MIDYLEQFPVLLFLLKVLIGAACVGSGILGALILPMILNHKLDPILGPKPGEKWEVGKSPAYPYYFANKALDYAKAIVSEDFAMKQFKVSSTTLREQFPAVVLILCNLYVILFRILIWVAIPFAAILWIESWF